MRNIPIIRTRIKRRIGRPPPVVTPRPRSGPRLHDGAIVLAQIWVHSTTRREGLASAEAAR
ncbi:Hypothetical protein BN69_2883 [Methylocystis sp. SC2]|nr:Hypothetical protein BN69_2883 [Methylocystis sp. SC2]